MEVSLLDVLAEIERKSDEFYARIRRIHDAGWIMTPKGYDRFFAGIETVFGSLLAYSIDQAGFYNARVQILFLIRQYRTSAPFIGVDCVTAAVSSLRMELEKKMSKVA